MSDRSTVVHCSACPSWRELASTKAETWRKALTHARQVHPKDQRILADAQRQAARHV